MKLKGFSIVWRPTPESPHVFYEETIWDGSNPKAMVFESRDEALGFLATLALEEIEDPQIVVVTLNTKGFKSE